MLAYDVLAKPRPLLDAQDAADGTGRGADGPPTMDALQTRREASSTLCDAIDLHLRNTFFAPRNVVNSF